MTSQTPTIAVSVNMAVYNAERHLPAAIDSILAQTFTDFEFLIIDDGSTDNSLKILKTYAKQDNRICVVSRENRGIAHTRNELLYQSQGEFIAIMDADDVAMPERFTSQVEFLRHHPEVVCVGSAYDVIDGEGRWLSHVEFPADDPDIQASILAGKARLRHSSAVVRRSSLLQVNGYNETMKAAIDLDLWLRLGEIGKLANLSKTLLHYRIHENSISEHQTNRQSLDAQQACERAWQRRNIQGSYEAPNSWRYQLILRYGWQMINNGEYHAAIGYGIRAVRILPFKPDSWKLLVYGVFKLALRRGLQ